MYSYGYNNTPSHCSFWGRTRQDTQPNTYYPPINQALNGLATSNPIYQLESMVSENSSLGLVTAARQSQRSYSSCSRYMYNASSYQDVPQRRDWRYRYNDEALGELCSWLQTAESTLASRLPPRAEARSSCAVLRPPPKEAKERRKASSEGEAVSPKKQLQSTSKKPEKGKHLF